MIPRARITRAHFCSTRPRRPSPTTRSPPPPTWWSVHGGDAADTAFIAAVLGKPVLYRSADPLDALEIAIFDEGDELGWHFDNSEFSVTVMYAQSEAGGQFDDYPALRTEHDDNYPGVQDVLLGRADGVIQAGREPRHARGFPRPARPAPGHPG